MRPLSASNLLEIWERGMGRTPVEQALIILGLVFPQAARESLTRLTVAQRDAALFHLRELTFSTLFKGLAQCPACYERLELAFSSDDLRAMDLLPDPDLPLYDTPAAVTQFRAKGYEVGFRLPTSADLLQIARLADAGRAHQHLLEACIVSARHRKQIVSITELPPAVMQNIVEQIGQAAAIANLTISATCPACSHQWEIVFDIVSYFWSEINTWAMRMLREIHVLASTYGWSEAEILAMSAWRRQRYLELIGA